MARSLLGMKRWVGNGDDVEEMTKHVPLCAVPRASKVDLHEFIKIFEVLCE